MTATTMFETFSAAVAERGDEPALIDAPNRSSIVAGEPRRLTWNELDAVITSAAGVLADLGATAHSTIAVQLPNIVELPISLLAAARLGAVAVPFPIQHRAHELRHGFATAGIDLMVTANRSDRPDQIESCMAVARETGVRVAAGEDVFGRQSNAVGTAAAPADGSPDDVATVCWTSGTTGTPKGVPRTHRMWAETATFQTETLNLGSGDRILCPFPIVNMAGIGGMLLPWLQAKAALVLHQPLDLPIFLRQLQAEEITYTVAPPPLLNMLLRDESVLADVDLSHLRTITSGSAPLDPWMIEGWEQRGVEIVNAFGSNEGVSMLSTRATVPDPAQRARLFPEPQRDGVQAKIIDMGSGAEITGIGQPGELLFGGPTVFNGYLDSDGSEFTDDGFFRSGDIFEWATDVEPRLLRFVDRAKDIIIRGGMNISAAEVEGLLSSHEAVAECAVVAYPDPDLGERVGVFVVPAPGVGVTLDDLADHMRGLEVASYKLPERLAVVDQLPRNPVGKIVKPRLRARWADGHVGDEETP